MLDWRWKKKEAIKEQCSFFGYKPKRFISVYAKKPRILVKAKSKPVIDYNNSNRDYLMRQGNSALLSNQASQDLSGGLGWLAAFGAAQASCGSAALAAHAQNQASLQAQLYQNQSRQQTMQSVQHLKRLGRAQ